MRSPTVVLFGLCGCAPRVWESTEWTGDERAAAGIVCEGHDIPAGGSMWVRVGVKWRNDTEIDWAVGQLDAQGAEVVSRDQGEARGAGDRTSMRYVTYTVSPTAAVGETVTLGPYTMIWRVKGDAGWREIEAPGCAATVREPASQ